MIKIVKTYKELQEIDNIVGAMYRKNPNLRDSKFGYAFKRFSDKNIAPTNKELQEKLQDIAVEHALEDPTTKELLLSVDKEYKYSREGQNKLNKAQRELAVEFLAKEIEVEPYISPRTPEMTEWEFEVLKGILVDASIQPETILEEKQLEESEK